MTKYKPKQALEYDLGLPLCDLRTVCEVNNNCHDLLVPVAWRKRYVIKSLRRTVVTSNVFWHVLRHDVTALLLRWWHTLIVTVVISSWRGGIMSRLGRLQFVWLSSGVTSSTRARNGKRAHVTVGEFVEPDVISEFRKMPLLCLSLMRLDMSIRLFFWLLFHNRQCLRTPKKFF